mgnify:CR=1 FL=1
MIDLVVDILRVVLKLGLFTKALLALELIEKLDKARDLV